jgi:hypothetical protein
MKGEHLLTEVGYDAKLQMRMTSMQIGFPETVYDWLFCAEILCGNTVSSAVRGGWSQTIP